MEQDKVFNLIVGEYVNKLSQSEHENILLKIEIMQLKARIQELEPEKEEKE